MEPRELASALIQTLNDKKALDIKILGTTELTTIADYFVIATATSETHIKTLSGACEEEMKKVGVIPSHIEGRHGGSWILLDFSSVVVHLFLEETRAFYSLERLWNDAVFIELDAFLGGSSREESLEIR